MFMFWLFGFGYVFKFIIWMIGIYGICNIGVLLKLWFGFKINFGV